MKQGQFQDFYEAVHSHTVQGSLEGGVRVRSGAKLLVQGVLGGPVYVEARAALVVQGVFNGAVMTNDGVISLAGVVNSLQTKMCEGELLVAANSLISAGGIAAILGPDGALVHLHAGDVLDSLDPSQSDFLRYNPMTKHFEH